MEAADGVKQRYSLEDAQAKVEAIRLLMWTNGAVLRTIRVSEETVRGFYRPDQSYSEQLGIAVDLDEELGLGMWAWTATPAGAVGDVSDGR